jgi:hypothetical protein
VIQYFVICRNDSWLVSLAGQEYGPFGSVADATDMAIQSAEICVGEGLAAKVMVEGRFGGFRAVWTGDAAAA